MDTELTQLQQSQLATILAANPSPFKSLISRLMSSSNAKHSQAEALFNLCKQTDLDGLVLKLGHLLHSSPHQEARAMSVILLRKRLTRDDSFPWPRLSPQTHSSLKPLHENNLNTNHYNPLLQPQILPRPNDTT
ncbi:unnamed protein product [Lathyrus sativus]|nr:unnamed protein product [Lathyrus sativus]